MHQSILLLLQLIANACVLSHAGTSGDRDSVTLQARSQLQLTQREVAVGGWVGEGRGGDMMDSDTHNSASSNVQYLPRQSHCNVYQKPVYTNISDKLPSPDM